MDQLGSTTTVTPRSGKVYLVGAGPGDPGLITRRGVECLQAADLVLYDGLANPLLLGLTHAETIRTCRAAHGETDRLSQDEVHRRLIAAAQAGLTVVRLKGGDPFVFGRGTEEAAALAAAGIPYEVVPGITAATGAAVYAGISLTHREHASAVAFITGHEDPTKPDTALDYQVLSKFPGTLVFYMGLQRIEAITRALQAQGKSPTTPAAVVSRATTPLQRTVTAPLAEIATTARSAGLSAPSLLIIGDCVRVREQAHWFEDRPLFGQVIGITRPAAQLTATAELAVQWGAQPVGMPTIDVQPIEDYAAVDAITPRLREFDWVVFTSVNGVQHWLNRLWSQGHDARILGGCRLACIGPGTATALAKFHLRADLVPDEYRGEALAEALVPHVAGKSVLWMRASRGRDVLPTRLREGGAAVTELVVYRNIDVEVWPTALQTQVASGELDWIALSSPSIARNLPRLLSPAALEQIGVRTKLASISPVTTAAAIEAGLTIAAEAAVYTWDGLFATIARAMGR